MTGLPGAVRCARNVGVAVSQLINAAFGGDPRESLCGRIGRSVRAGGIAAQLPLPGWLRQHCLWSIRED